MTHDKRLGDRNSNNSLLYFQYFAVSAGFRRNETDQALSDHPPGRWRVYACLWWSMCRSADDGSYRRFRQRNVFPGKRITGYSVRAS